MCLIIQETKIRKPRYSNLGVSSLCKDWTTWFSGNWSHVHFPGPCIKWTSFTSGPALVKALCNLLIAFQCLLLAHTRFSFWKVTNFHRVWKPLDIYVQLLWGVSAPTIYSKHSDDRDRVPYKFSLLFLSFAVFFYFPKLKNNLKYSILRCIVLNSNYLSIFLKL